ncbi:MAG: hypothetical protein IKT99_03520 [Oscillospiraceae bacterium]|nr:hypothetical protein [Oscillospiraceae bacterium]
MENNGINNKDLQVGEWYTCYSAGFWQLIQTFPKYATFDYVGENAKWKKGDLIGQWCIVKKAFTPKMKKIFVWSLRILRG